VGRADRLRLAAARQVVRVARIAEDDRSVRRVEDLAARAGVSVRTLQRLFSQYAGVSPTWVLRRYRLLEAAELVRHGDAGLQAAGGWAGLAAELGYSDQPHLSRDFKALRRSAGRLRGPAVGALRVRGRRRPWPWP
jgi:transcriptional regulator GlxA family with amidase domain